jgi:hypothetical protein
MQGGGKDYSLLVERDKPKEERDTLTFYKNNPELATFKLQELAQAIEANPENKEALAEYEKITQAASQGSIEKFSKEQKDQTELELLGVRLTKYKQDIVDAERLSPGARWNAEIDAARDLLKVYKIDRTKPLADQVPASVLYSPLASELTNAYKKAGTRKTNEGGKVEEAGTTSTDPSITTALQAAGLPYEPAKYDYRIVNGQVQRKLKGN